MLVFISHSRQNSGAALKLADELTRRGFNVWLDLRKLDSGAGWEQRVSDAVRQSRAFVFLIGPPTPSDKWMPTDRWQQYEWKRVIEEEHYLDPSISLVPVLIGAPEIPGFLSVRPSISVAETAIDFIAVADFVVHAIENPSENVDEGKLGRAREAREQAMREYRRYLADLARDEVTLAGLRALK